MRNSLLHSEEDIAVQILILKKNQRHHKERILFTTKTVVWLLLNI